MNQKEEKANIIENMTQIKKTLKNMNVKVDMKKIGQNFKNIRLEKNLTQKELAKVIELSSNAISYFENGKSSISFERMIQLCQVLEVSLFDMLKGTSIVRTKIPKETSEKYQQLNDINKKIVDDILTAFIKNQRVAEKSEEFHFRNINHYNDYDYKRYDEYNRYNDNYRDERYDDYE